MSDFPRKQLIPILGVALIYAALACLGLLMAIPKTNTSPVWPPSGFAFAALLILGRRVWPGITIGAFLGNLITFLINPPASYSLLVAASLVISIGNTLEAVAGSFLLERLIGKRNPLDRTPDAFCFIGVAAVMCLVACTIGPTFLCASHITNWKMYSTIWSTWWIGDTTGVLILTPTLLAWLKRDQPPLTPVQRVELALAVSIVLVMGLGLFGLPPSTNPLHRQAYLIILPLLWIVFRFYAREALTMATIISVLAVHATVQGHGAFAVFNLNMSLELLVIFVSVLTITCMLLGAVCAERTRAQKEAAERAEQAVILHEHERNIATTLQQALQPSDLCPIPGLSLDYYYKAALNEASIGGDFFDAFPMSNGRYALVIGDISGKGLAAAIQVASVRNMLRFALLLRDEVADAVTELNRIVGDHDLLAGFATVLVCIYDTGTRQLTHVSCGHEPALRFSPASGVVDCLMPTGPPLGITEFEYRSDTTTLTPGDRLLLYTDGISEAKVEVSELLNSEGLSSLLSAYAMSCPSPAALIEHIMGNVESRIVEPFRDDACLIALQVE